MEEEREVSVCVVVGVRAVVMGVWVVGMKSVVLSLGSARQVQLRKNTNVENEKDE